MQTKFYVIKSVYVGHDMIGSTFTISGTFGWLEILYNIFNSYTTMQASVVCFLNFEF